MTNTLNKIMHDGDEYLLPEGFSPDNAGTTDDVLTKTANGYEWAAPSGGDVVVSSQPNNILTSGMKIWAGLETDFGSLTPDSNTVYLLTAGGGGGGWQPGVNTLAYYQFEQNLNDSSGNGYNITTSSDYSFVEVGGQYVVQDGGSIRLGLPYAPFNTIGTGDFAISFWLYPITPSNTSNREPVILGSARSYSPYVGPGIFYDYYGYGDEGMTNPDRKIYWRTARGVYGLGGLTADYINGWHHFVMTRISGTVYCYVDKVQVCQYSSSSDISGITGLGSFVGASSNREPQGWGTSGAKGDSLILENIGWTSQNVSDYFDQTKATYGIS